MGALGDKGVQDQESTDYGYGQDTWGWALHARCLINKPYFMRGGKSEEIQETRGLNGRFAVPRV